MPSTASVIAPASGPNCSTHANANSSEIDSRESIDGTLSVKNPLAIVRAPKTIHSRGTPANASMNPQRAAMATPARTTETTRTRVREVTSVPVARPRAAPDHVVRVRVVAAAPDHVLARRRLDRAAPDHVVAARPVGDLSPDQTVRPAAPRAGSTARAGSVRPIRRPPRRRTARRGRAGASRRSPVRS